MTKPLLVHKISKDWTLNTVPVLDDKLVNLNTIVTLTTLKLTKCRIRKVAYNEAPSKKSDKLTQETATQCLTHQQSWLNVAQRTNNFSWRTKSQVSSPTQLGMIRRALSNSKKVIQNRSKKATPPSLPSPYSRPTCANQTNTNNQAMVWTTFRSKVYCKISYKLRKATLDWKSTLRKLIQKAV